jgi:hypothetical protein
MSSQRGRQIGTDQSRPSTANLPASRDRSSVQPYQPVDVVALEAFAAELGNTARETQDAGLARYNQVKRRDSFLFMASAISAVLVPILIALGLILIVVLNNRVGGAITSSAGLIGGAGTAGLFSLRKQNAKELRDLKEEIDTDARLYQAVRLAGMIRDPSQQAAALGTLASDVMRQNVNRRIEIEEERGS